MDFNHLTCIMIDPKALTMLNISKMAVMGGWKSFARIGRGEPGMVAGGGGGFVMGGWKTFKVSLAFLS